MSRLIHPMLVSAGLLYLAATPFQLLTQFDRRPYSQIAALYSYRVDSLLGLAAIVCLTVGIVASFRKEGPDGRTISTFASVSVLLGLMAATFLQGVSVFLVPSLAVSAPAVLDAPPVGTHAVGVIASLSLFIGGLLWLSASAYRARCFPELPWSLSRWAPAPSCWE